MKRIWLSWIVLFSISAAMAGCGAFAPQTMNQAPTPDLTLTALFAPTQGPSLSPTVTETTQPTVTETPAGLTETPTLTATITATITPTGQTATSTSLPQRPGPLVYAYFISPAPVLDGNWGDWKDKTIDYPMNYVVYGRSNWSGADDLEPSYILGWDATYLYIGIKVHDDVYAQHATGAEIFKGDSAEILIDTNLWGDFYTQTLNNDDYQIGFSPGFGSITGAKEAYVWNPSAVAGTRSQIKITSLAEAGLYRMEIAVPWSTLGISPSAGMGFGFVISVSDNDNTEANIQQTMMSNDAARTTYTDPTIWGEMILR
jgi:hypothetical protein